MTVQVHFPLTIFYDHSCAMCRSEMLHIQARDHAGVLHLVDASDAAALAAARVDRPQHELMALLHARDAAGRWLVGVEVFEVVYAAAGMGWLSRLLRVAPVRAWAQRLYPHVARHRYRMPAWLARLVFDGVHAGAGTRVARAAQDWQDRRCGAGEACRLDSREGD